LFYLVRVFAGGGVPAQAFELELLGALRDHLPLLGGVFGLELQAPLLFELLPPLLFRRGFGGPRFEVRVEPAPYAPPPRRPRQHAEGVPCQKAQKLGWAHAVVAVGVHYCEQPGLQAPRLSDGGAW
jgi:hypothetical protein